MHIGNSGYVHIAIGPAQLGSGGAINLQVGAGASGDGGDVRIGDGETSAQGKQGGSIEIVGGVGSFGAAGLDGGSDGDVLLGGGEARGTRPSNRGGDVSVSSGAVEEGTGGAIRVTSGASAHHASGLIAIRTLTLALVACPTVSLLALVRRLTLTPVRLSCPLFPRSQDMTETSWSQWAAATLAKEGTRLSLLALATLWPDVLVAM